VVSTQSTTRYMEQFFFFFFFFFHTHSNVLLNLSAEHKNTAREGNAARCARTRDFLLGKAAAGSKTKGG
jgi:hypothetical protein